MRVLLADDHQLIVEGLSNLLLANGIDVAGIALNGRVAVEKALALEPDLVLMDLRMPVCDGLTATRLIRAQRPDIRIVMLTTSAEDE
ncbi:MAG: response regulator transcription factor, partial [Caldilineaceae bacterium]